MKCERQNRLMPLPDEKTEATEVAEPDHDWVSGKQQSRDTDTGVVSPNWPSI